MTAREHPYPPEDTLLDAYLDGQLDAERSSAFEAEIASSPELRAAVDLQRRIDASLARLFVEPPAESLDPKAKPPSRRLIHPALLGLAAAVLIVTAGLWAFATLALQESRDRLGPAYQEIVAAGFEPQIVCTTTEEFAGWLRENYGQALYPADDPGIQYVGWSYANVVSGYSGVLLANVDGERVIVIVDRRDRDDARQLRPQDRSLSIHRRAIGDLVLYEVTPLGRARILPVLSESRP